jgi:hypothetical protein
VRRPRTWFAAAALMLALAGCASADKTAQNVADTSTSSSMAGMSMSGSSAGSAVGSTGSSTNMNTATVLNAQGVPTPVPTKTLGSGQWKDMDITAQEMTPVPFYVDEGTSFKEVKPTKSTSFHLMVMLTDKHTGQPIPYATVWAVIKKDGKTVFNEPQWAMLSEFMGPHYGNDVSLPGPGTYQLQVQVSAPKAAMHVEYANMWSGTHTVTSTFRWK